MSLELWGNKKRQITLLMVLLLGWAASGCKSKANLPITSASADETLSQPVSKGFSFHADGLTLSVDESGYLSALSVKDMDVMAHVLSPLLIACREGTLAFPSRFGQASGNEYEISFDDGGLCRIRMEERDAYLKLALVDGGGYEAILISPVALQLDEVVGETVGVVQGKGVAFGMRALNVKAQAGVPLEYVEMIGEKLGYEGQPVEIAASIIPARNLSAVRTKKGARMQFFVRDYCREEKRVVRGVADCTVQAMPSDEGKVEGASVAFFGCAKDEALARINAIEQNESQLRFRDNRDVLEPYLIADFSEGDLDFVLEKCRLAGIGVLCRSHPFDVMGHFHWHPDFVVGGSAAVRSLVEKAERQGVRLGIQMEAGSITTNDGYVAPEPSPHLLKQGTLMLKTNIGADQVDFAVYGSPLFAKPATINVLQIGDELISYRTTERSGDIQMLHSCQRGAFGTKVVAHGADETVFKLWDSPNQTLFPDLSLQDELVTRLATAFNETGLSYVSFEGLDVLSSTGHDDRAAERFVQRFQENLSHDVRVDADRLTHYNWHSVSCVNLGEPWHEAMRARQLEANDQCLDFLRRNLFPMMFGRFSVNLADRQKQCTAIEDVEWVLAKAAGYDACWAMDFNVNAMRHHGQTDAIMALVHDWETFRRVHALSEEQKARLREPYTEWHLDKVGDSLFRLYEMYVSRRFRCDGKDLALGQVEWHWESPCEGTFALRLYVEGDGAVSNLVISTSDGQLVFPCSVRSGQYLLYDFSGEAWVADKNYNFIESVAVEGESAFVEGENAIIFTGDVEKEVQGQTKVSVRFMTRLLEN